MPVIGALGGAAVNYAFIDHFQEIGRAHFIVRRLERRFGKDAVREAYEKLFRRDARSRLSAILSSLPLAASIEGPLAA